MEEVLLVLEYDENERTRTTMQRLAIDNKVINDTGNFERSRCNKSMVLYYFLFLFDFRIECRQN